MSFPSTPIIDDLNGADTGPPPGPLWSSPIWSGQSGLTRLGNQLAGAAAWKDAYVSAAYGADQEVYATLAVLPAGTNGVFLHGRIQTSGLGSASPNTYALRLSPGSPYLFEIQKVVAGTNTTIGTGATAAVSAGDVIGMSLIGSTITAYLNGAQIVQVTDATFPGGGRVGAEWNDATLRMDDFGGGSTVGAQDPREAAMTGPLDGAATIRVRRSEDQGHQVLLHAGILDTPPSSPTDPDWDLAVSLAPAAGEFADLTVPLPTNDDDYTAAVYGWDGGTGFSQDPLLVPLFGVIPPTLGPLGERFASAVIETARPGLPYVQTSTSPGFETVQTYDALVEGVSAWRLLDTAAGIEDPSSGAALDPAGWPAGSEGKIVRRALPIALADRYHRFAHRVRAT